MNPQELLAHYMEQRRFQEDPNDADSIQAMQLVLHLPKNLPEGATRADFLAAAGQAVLEVCLSPLAETDTTYRAALEQWYGHRIRKVARRARNSAWEAVQDLPGATVQVGHAQVRAFLPSAVYQVPAPIKKLQIKGTDLPADADLPELPKDQPVVLVQRDLQMTLGKAAAQVGHATMLFAAQHPMDASTPWGVREVSGAEFARLAPQADVVVRDAGFTEVAPDSMTVAAFAKRPW